MNIVAGNMGAAAATTAAADGATDIVMGAVMGVRLGCGVVTPTGAVGEGVGSAMASGCGAGFLAGLVTAFLTGLACACGFGGAGSTLDAGGSISWVNISAGITRSAARINNPLCSAHTKATCSETTAVAMMM